MRTASITTILLTAAAVLVPTLAHAQDGGGDISEETVEYFRTNCTSCHTIGGGRLAGPDLKGAADRKDAAWMTKFIMDPKGVIDSGDVYAQDLLREAKGVYMTNIPGMSRDRASKLVALIAYESTLEESRFAGTQISDRPLTPADVERGRRLFEGGEDFKNGGPACISCHEVDGTPGFGGGRLGPDLTDAYSRLEGRKALGAWLSAPPSLTMQPIFKEHPIDSDEVLPLVAYLKSTAETGSPAPIRGPLSFLIAGVVGAAVVLVGFDLIWRRRFRGVRRELLRSATR